MRESTKKYVKAILNILVTLIVVLLIIFLVPRLIPYFTPFIIGWIIACIAWPPVRFFEEKLKIKRKAGSAFVVIVVIGVVVLCLYLIGAKLVEEIVGFVGDLPEMWGSLQKDFNDISQNMSGIYEKLPKNVQDTLANIGASAYDIVVDLLERLSSPTLEAVGNFALQLPTIIIGIIMCLLSSYFFVAERGIWSKGIRKLVPESVQFRLSLVKRSILKAVGGYFKAQLKIEIWIYLLLVIGLLILQVDYVLLVALGIAFLDFFPFFGTGTVMVPWAIIKFLSADYKMTIGLLIIWGVGQLVRQIIQPKIMGDSMGMPPLPTLVLLYIGYKIGGVFGMILAVPIGIIVVTMYQEGAFDTIKKSFQILSAGLNRFRRIREQDMEEVHLYKQECEQEAQKRKEENEKL
ncbi:MAG: sporulation integral membrane protein YtvI [Lachnospiraceae bacterium]|nr:sporulation integral membrane protein YtvI [Lachnospiraceae bacterium]